MGSSTLPPVGARHFHPLPGVKPKPAPLGSDPLLCAWHDALTDLLVETPEEKNTRRYRTEGQRRQGKGSSQKWGV